MLNNSKICLSVIWLLMLVLSACQPSSAAPQTQVAQISPQVTIQGDNQNKEELQTIELNNCDGKGDMTRTELRSQSVDVTISAEIAAKIGASAAVISADVQAAVGASSTQGASRSTSIQLLAPPRTRMAFQLSWTGKEQIGVVQNVRNSSIPIAFRTFIPTDVRIKSQQDIGCPGSSAPQPVLPIPPTYTPMPTLTPYPTSTPYPTVPPPTMRPMATPIVMPSIPPPSPCPLTIRQSELSSWRIGTADVPTVQKFINTFDSKRPGDVGAFKAGTQIPKGVIVATNYWEAGVHWTQFPVIPVVNSGDWGLFETIGEYTAPYAGACVTMVP